MNWKILNIEPTKDKKEIKQAYRKQLTMVNPEDKPEEFKQLREAYEEAMCLADEVDEVVEHVKTPIDVWMDKIRKLYQDFPARIDVENWKKIMEDDVCVELDKRSQAEEALLRFLMEDYYIPQAVWQLFDDTFSWVKRKNELYEAYPRDFVDYAIINAICYPASLPYDLFQPGVNAYDCDQYRRLYYQAKRMDLAELGPVLEQFEALSEWHPYGQVMQYLYDIQQGLVEQGKEGIHQLANEYPDNVALVMEWAAQCSDDENWIEECEPLARHVLELNPDHYQAKKMLADCLANSNREEQAKDLIFELMHAAGGDSRQLYYLNQLIKDINNRLLSRLEEELQNHPEDDKTAIDLAWCYLQNERKEEAMTLCKKIRPDYEDRYNYENLFAKTCYFCQEFEEALVHFERLETIIRSYGEDCSSKEVKRVKRLPEVLQLKGACLAALDRKEEGRAEFEKSLELAPDDAEILTQMANMLYNEKDYQRAVELLNHLIEVLPSGYHGFYLLSLCLYELHRDKDAFDAINRALELEGSDLGVYILKMRILLRNGVWDQVHEIIDFLHQNEIHDHLPVMWCEAQLMEWENENVEEALKQYQEIARRVEEGEELPWASELYFRIAICLADNKDARKEEDRAELLAILNKGLEYNAEDLDCLNYKAWLLKRDKKTEEAIELYHQLEQRPNHSINVERELAELYYEDLSHHADQAYHYYQKSLDYEENWVFHFYSGVCCRYMMDWETAEKEFLREIEIDPDGVDGYQGLGYVYEATGRLEEALKNANKAIELWKDKEGNQSSYFFRKIQILRRMGRPYEAISVVDEIVERYGYDFAETMKFEIYCQFGLWDDAEKFLDQWKKSKKNVNAQHGAQVKLDMYLGKYKEAREALAKGKKKFDSEEYETLLQAMHDLDGDYESLIVDWQSRVEKNGDSDDYAMMQVAEAYWNSGNKEKAIEYAKRALEVQQGELQLFLKERALYQGRSSLMLAILGEEEEARKELEKTYHLPLCQGCDYCCCKDADIYQAKMEEIFGNYQKAMELYCEGMKRWCDELDFVAGMLRLKRRGI